MDPKGAMAMATKRKQERKRRDVDLFVTDEGCKGLYVHAAGVLPFTGPSALLQAWGTGLPLTYFGAGAYLPIADAVAWCAKECRKNRAYARAAMPDMPGTWILKQLRRMQRDFDAGLVEFEDPEG
jgi:hypothetical protein